MIYGIGTDIVEIPRLKSVLDRWGDRFVGRVFTEEEVTYCNGKAHRAAGYALRFAAKEAFVKALGTGFGAGLFFQQIEVTHDENGAPLFRLHGKGRSACRDRGIKKSFLSLSDDGTYAVAFVVLEA
jgi:holo-[acyl-carrier protein] synthase